jgi:hypothetical protein
MLQSEFDFVAFADSLSRPRLRRYVQVANGDLKLALTLYRWNTQLSQELYLYLQGFEIVLRNRLNNHVIQKFGPEWPFHGSRFLAVMKQAERRKIGGIIEGYRRRNQGQNPSLDQIVSDLTLGFWVALLTDTFDPWLRWREETKAIFPNLESINIRLAWRMSERFRKLRNRIAHHEPIFHLPLNVIRDDLTFLVGAMCQDSATYLEQHCRFRAVLAAKPTVRGEPPLFGTLTLR